MTQHQEQSFTLTIHYISGKSEVFEFPSQGWAETGSVASRLASLQQADKLAIEVADTSLRVIPWSSILYVDISPCPSPIPATVIKGATVLPAS